MSGYFLSLLSYDPFPINTELDFTKHFISRKLSLRSSYTWTYVCYCAPHPIHVLRPYLWSGGIWPWNLGWELGLDEVLTVGPQVRPVFYKKKWSVLIFPFSLSLFFFSLFPPPPPSIHTHTPWKDRARRRLSASKEEGPHQELNLLVADTLISEPLDLEK